MPEQQETQVRSLGLLLQPGSERIAIADLSPSHGARHAKSAARRAEHLEKHAQKPGVEMLFKVSHTHSARPVSMGTSITVSSWTLPGRT
jgi:hypothetical protein